MKKLLCIITAILIFAATVTACGIIDQSEPFYEEALLVQLREAVLQRETELIYRCEDSEDLEDLIDLTLDKAYSEYIFGANISNVSWAIVRMFSEAEISFSLEYSGAFQDNRSSAWEYSEEKLTEVVMDAIKENRSDLKMLMINDGTLTDDMIGDYFDDVLFSGHSAHMTYYLDSAEYSIRAYSDYIDIDLNLEFTQDVALPVTELQTPENLDDAIEMVIEQWEEQDTALLYLPEAPEDAEAYCSTLVLAATANDADSTYLCESYQWNTYGTADMIVMVRGVCDYDAADLQKKQEELLAAAETLAAQIDAEDEKEAVKQIAGLLCDHVSYDNIMANEVIGKTTYTHEININRTAYGALIGGKSICTGYSKAFQLICDLKGIECWTIDGSVDDVGHEWNAVYIDGERYYVDVTFADTSRDRDYCLFGDKLYRKSGYIPDEGYYIPAA